MSMSLNETDLTTSGAVCPLCASTDSRPRSTYTAMLGLPGHSPSSVYECSSCAVRFLWPYISADEIGELYKKSYFTGVTEQGETHGLPASNSNYEQEFAARRLGKFAESVSLLRRYVPGARTILDIGAATGEFLSIARDAGLDTAGIELSPYAAAKAKEKYGFDFHQGGIVEYPGRQCFDLIHLNHVFEHFDAPHAALDRIHQLLNPAGAVYVEVPYQFNAIELLKYRLTGRGQRYDVFSIHHPVFYTPATLKKIFSAHGFECRELRVFRWTRYPAAGAGGQLKRLMWLAAALVGHGLMIEAVFMRKR